MKDGLTIIAATLLALGLLIATLGTPAMPCVRLGNMPIAGACH